MDTNKSTKYDEQDGYSEIDEAQRKKYEDEYRQETGCDGERIIWDPEE